MLKRRIVDISFFAIIFIVAVNDAFGSMSPWFYLVPVIVYCGFHIYGSINLGAEYFVPVRSRAAVAANAISLTFDDGPIPGKTEKVLEILKNYQAPAAFFCIGHRVKENPSLARRIHAEGHLVCNHSYWHGKTFDLQTTSRIAGELTDTDAIIKNSVGLVPRFFRPPYGVTNPMVAGAIAKTNHITVGWSIRSFDTVIKDSAALMKRITSKLKPGDIVLFHDYSDSMLEILPALLDHISNTGLKIVRIDELLDEKPYV
jgi:peptidoglycan/xylan/chitin deacetylase (PgdA/CDA1 family)